MALSKYWHFPAPTFAASSRSRHRRVPDDYAALHPSFVARHKPKAARVVMAYFGLQYHGEAPPAVASALVDIAARFADAQGPAHWDRAQYFDQAGYSNVVSVAYWDPVAPFPRLRSSRMADRHLQVSSHAFPLFKARRQLQYSGGIMEPGNRDTR